MWVTRKELEQLRDELRDLKRGQEQIEKELRSIARHFQWPPQGSDVLPLPPRQDDEQDEISTKK